MREKIVAGNWKLHKNPVQSAAFVQELQSSPGFKTSGASLLLFPQAVSVLSAVESAKGSSVRLGAQNCSQHATGAFTGETSPQVLSELGCRYVLVGHSERRQLFGETDETLSFKVQAAQKFGLIPMLCVGETLQERESGQTLEVIGRQLKQGLSRADLSKPLTLAYEPVWAIGTGRVATTAQAEEAHAGLRKVLGILGGKAFGDQTPILYGGSVKPDNAPELSKQANIDGFLVGGASLEVASFLAIAKVYEK